MRLKFGNASSSFSRSAVGVVQVEPPAIRISLSPTIIRGDFRKTPPNKIRFMPCDASIFPVPLEDEDEPGK
jgi:hypothetical protein